MGTTRISQWRMKIVLEHQSKSVNKQPEYSVSKYSMVTLSMGECCQFRGNRKAGLGYPGNVGSWIRYFKCWNNIGIKGSWIR